jgi:hypothetical protein
MERLSKKQKATYIFVIIAFMLFPATGHLRAERIYGSVYHNGPGWWAYVYDDLREGGYDSGVAGPNFDIDPATPGYRSIFVQSTATPYVYVPEVYLPVSGEVYLELDTDPVYHVPAGPTVAVGAPSQRFVADGGNHIMGFHWAAADRWNSENEISIHFGRTDGPQIGRVCHCPLHVFDVSHTSATWSAGEIPLLPGEDYFLRIGPWGAANRAAWVTDTDVYPDGELWIYGDQPLPNVDVVGMVSDEYDGVLTVFNNKVDGWQWEGLYDAWAQTFVAYGDYVIAADCIPGVGDQPWKDYGISIREGGPDGPQIGPEKTMLGALGISYECVVWRPGEVPVTPGETYALHIRQLNNYQLICWHSPSYLDHYPYGSAYYYSGGQWTDAGWDLKGSVVCAGYLPSFNISDIQVSNISDTKATISWTTDVPSMGRVLYGTTPALGSKWGPDEEFVTEHSFRLRELDPDTQYHFKVDGCAYFHQYTQSEELTFTTTNIGVGTLTGTVTDEDDVPMEGVTVSTVVGDYSTETLPDGSYTITSVDPDDYTVEASKLWYVTQSQDVEVGPGETVVVDFTMPKLMATVENPGFETGDLTAWTIWGKAGGVPTGCAYSVICPHSGNHFQMNDCNWWFKNGGLYQKIWVEPGTTYKVQTFSAIYWLGGSMGGTRSWLAVDPQAGTDHNAPSVIYSDMHVNPVEAEEPVTWVPLTVEVTAETEQMTIFLVFEQDYGGQWHINCFDDVAIYYPTDFNSDGRVDFLDHAILANHWMMMQDCAEHDWCKGADLDKNGSVDWYDLAEFVEYWLAPSFGY